MTKLGQKVIYQIYPKSFYDSNNDGFEDLQGIIAKIDYLKKLNIDMIWFNPFYASPQNDNGYDIADYYKIDKRFGTMEDFEEMVAKLKEANIGVMLDMVLNHCSTEHEWFQKADICQLVWLTKNTSYENVGGIFLRKNTIDS